MKNNMKLYKDYEIFSKKIKCENEFIPIFFKNEENGISFTPYIYNDCSANCKFCSEKLIRNGNIMICKEITPDYNSKLQLILDKLMGKDIFLSISGKEPSESICFLENILKQIKKYEDKGLSITEKVMYSNLSGFIDNLDELTRIIKKYNLDRVECSRHHYDEEINQHIMNFKNSKIRKNANFDRIIENLQNNIKIKMVCVLQKEGINSVSEIKKYLEYAKKLNVTDVVFRELAMFENCVDRGETTQYIENNRIELMDLIEQLPQNEFIIKQIIQGYYYFSFQYQYDDIQVNFEMSDYEEMIRKHNSQKCYKIIYYPNGKLCGDWNMRNEMNIDRFV